jgi:hypothetical protein
MPAPRDVRDGPPRHAARAARRALPLRESCRSTAALKPSNSGCGRVGRERSLGGTAAHHPRVVPQLEDLTRAPSGVVPLGTRPACSNSSRYSLLNS